MVSRGASRRTIVRTRQGTTPAPQQRIAAAEHEGGSHTGRIGLAPVWAREAWPYKGIAEGGGESPRGGVARSGGRGRKGLLG